MIFCTNCGKQLDDGARFCPNCGAQLQPPAPVQQPAQQQTVQQQDYQQQQAYQQQPVQQQPYQQQPVTPPVQYQPQQGYTQPQQQQPYQQQPVQQPAQQQKKGGGKALIFIIGGVVLACLIAAALYFFVFNKDGLGLNLNGSDDPNVGLWQADTAIMFGMEMDVDGVFEQPVTLELKDKGKCVLNIEGADYNIKWNVDGESFSLTGGGVDCTGTIKDGVLTVENMLDMGLDLVFVKEGAEKPASANNADNDGDATPVELSEIQKQWNGTWYGSLYVSGAEGAYVTDWDLYDAYVVIDVDKDGAGTIAVYVGESDKAFSIIQCQATSYYMDIVSGKIAGGIDVDPDEWRMFENSDEDERFVIADEISDENGFFSYTVIIKKWGADWHREQENTAYSFTPPSIAEYNDAIANAQQPPVGCAPYGYAGN